MKLTGDLKKHVEKAGSKEEKKSLIENAGMLLSDDELEKVAGGIIQPRPSDILPEKNKRLNEV
ncbi:MAG: hypothetical protein K6F86_01855 [Lachnospiraceae bacterium]|nr:hypothetical protein [Lachnospiraceae bacterium]